MLGILGVVGVGRLACWRSSMLSSNASCSSLSLDGRVTTQAEFDHLVRDIVQSQRPPVGHTTNPLPLSPSLSLHPQAIILYSSDSVDNAICVGAFNAGDTVFPCGVACE